MCQVSGKTDNFGFFSPNLPKNGYRVGNSENECWNKNQHPRDTMCANFQEKQTTLNFVTKIYPKIDLGLEIQKQNKNQNKNRHPGDSVCANFPAKRIFFTFSVQISPESDFGVEISKIYVRIQNQYLQDTLCANFQSKRRAFNFLA